jgi:hypothetical protein
MGFDFAFFFFEKRFFFPQKRDGISDATGDFRFVLPSPKGGVGARNSAPVTENPSPGSLGRGSGSLKLAAQQRAPGKTR